MQIIYILCPTILIVAAQVDATRGDARDMDYMRPPITSVMINGARTKSKLSRVDTLVRGGPSGAISPCLGRRGADQSR